MNTTKLFALSFLLLASCEAKKNASTQTLPGAYVREFTTEVQHAETGEMLGSSTFRDTIYIQAQNNLFQIRHSKWRLNDFDDKGWQNQQHAENRPMPVFQAQLNPDDNSLEAKDVAGQKLIYDATPQPVLYSDNNHQVKYYKVP